jgi:hypothetical protein
MVHVTMDNIGIFNLYLPEMKNVINTLTYKFCCKLRDKTKINYVISCNRITSPAAIDVTGYHRSVLAIDISV